MIHEITNDTSRFAAVPFWFWNGDQTENEITRQLHLAKAGGWRGLTVHARTGNKTEYLSERWMALFRHTCAEAKKLGLEIWLYDEEGFPSGSVGGRLLKKDNGKYQCKYLTWETVSGADAANTPNAIAFFDAADPGRQIDSKDLPCSGDVIVFRWDIISYTADNLNPETGAEFLAMTHRKYEEAIGDLLGDPVTVLYTDDIGYLYTYNIPHTLPWTGDLEQIFQKRNGCTLTDKLSALAYDLPHSARTRRDFFETVTCLLNENFVRPMQNWAKAHNMKYTGHLCCDEGPVSKMMLTFGDPSAFYLEEDIPGVDDFLTGNRTNRYMSEPRNDHGKLVNNVRGFPIAVLCKQASSIASQFKNGKCSSEVLTSLGWGVPVANQMAQIFFQLTLGINIIVHHDCSYTTEGITKRDHPASFFFQQPYFAVNREIYAPLNRSLALLNRGRIDADVLLLHPINVAWEDLETDPAKKIESETELLQNITLELLRRHISFEYGFERAVLRTNLVSNGRLVVGDCAYSTVIVPWKEERTPEKIRPLLKELTVQGGKVVYALSVADLPEDLPGVFDNIAAGTVHPEIAVCRRTGGEHYLVNYSTSAQEITLKEPEKIAVYDPFTGMIAEHRGVIRLEPLRSCHLLPADAIPQEAVRSGIEHTGLVPGGRHIPAGIPLNEWKISRKNSNVYLIDTAESGLRFDDTASQPGDVIRCRITIPEGLTRKDLFLAYEPASAEDLKLNGTAVTGTVPHPATQALMTADVSDLLHAGDNELEFKPTGTRPEYLYLTGDFSVDTSAAICAPASAGWGDLTQQGLPYYWGQVTYETDFELDQIPEDLFLEFAGADGVVRAEINGADAGTLFDPPWRFDLTKGVLQTGRNALRLTLYNTAQNFFGPHTVPALEGQYWSWKFNWKKDQKIVTAPFGIANEPELTKFEE